MGKPIFQWITLQKKSTANNDKLLTELGQTLYRVTEAARENGKRETYKQVEPVLRSPRNDPGIFYPCAGWDYCSDMGEKPPKYEATLQISSLQK